MKYTIGTLLLTFLAFSINAQEIKETAKIMSLGSKNAFVIDHPRATDKMVEKAWEDYMKEYGKAKKNRKAKEFESFGAKIPMISSSEMNVFMKIEEGVDEASSFIFFDDGTKFISSSNDGDAVEAIYTFLTPYVYEVEKLVVQEDLDNEEKTLKGFVKDLDKLVKENENLHKDIEEWKRKIMEAEAAIEENLVNQDNKQIEIETQEGVVEETKDKLNNIGKG